ncbi:MAG TPA: diguanylate cyclase [Bacillota bacterium]|nr:diguanylate cyclase [Bacillota bacterium]HPL54645.1 diguanylate cyclase [Bacillota bacterium]
MIEYPSKNDFFLSFKALVNEEGQFIDYILVNIGDSFQMVTNIKAEKVLGKKISEIAHEYENNLFGIKDIYYNMIPKARRKFEFYTGELDRWYLINIFSDNRDFLVLFYNDVTRIKKSRGAADAKGKRGGVVYSLDEKREYGYKDKLTGLYNRDFFEEELSRLNTKRQLPISVIMGDLSGLKLINDAFGHDMGDKALKRVAEIIKRAFRKEDIVSRVGGDEFVVLLPRTSEETAVSIVKRIKHDCAANPLDFIKINASFGIATKTVAEEDIQEIYKKAEDRMYFNKLTESREAKHEMIMYIKDRLEELSYESRSHIERLQELCNMMADSLGLSEIEREELRLLCEYHDIGEIGIPRKIMQKKEPLSMTERENLRRHSEIGYHIIGSFKESIAVDGLILTHHERWDGKGYPGLLKGESIPLTARVFAIADAYEAMISERPYKSRINNEDALTEISSKAGTQFDPVLARTFVQLMKTEEAVV